MGFCFTLCAVGRLLVLGTSYLQGRKTSLQGAHLLGLHRVDFVQQPDGLHSVPSLHNGIRCKTAQQTRCGLGRMLRHGCRQREAVRARCARERDKLLYGVLHGTGRVLAFSKGQTNAHTHGERGCLIAREQTCCPHCPPLPHGISQPVPVLPGHQISGLRITGDIRALYQGVDRTVTQSC